jgi:hypothetical protein
MRQNTFALILCLLVSPFAQGSSTEAFILGLKEDLLFLKTERTIELSNKIRVTSFGVLAKLISSDAVATYNDKTNTISLSEENLESVRYEKRIKDARVIRGPQYMFGPNVTIFHEMGHAELDVFIENRQSKIESEIMAHYENVLRPFYRQNFPSASPDLLFQEHFAYYRSELVESFYSYKDDLLMFNGYNKFTDKCVLTIEMKNQIKGGLTLNELKKIRLYQPDADKSYSQKINVKYAYVKGKEFNLSSGKNAEAILNKTHELFWNYHQIYYDFPSTPRELATRLSQDKVFSSKIAKCRELLWRSIIQ